MVGGVYVRVRCHYVDRVTKEGVKGWVASHYLAVTIRGLYMRSAVRYTEHQLNRLKRH